MNEARTVVGTPFYMSPEVCENKPYDFKSDVWAMGCILYELCALEPAFKASSLLAVVQKIVQEEPSPIPTIYSEELRSLLSQLLAKDPKDRPSVKKIFQLPFIRERLESLAKSSSLPELDHFESLATTPGRSSSHHREGSLSSLEKSKSLDLKETTSNLFSTPSVPLPKIRRSSSQLYGLDTQGSSSNPPPSGLSQVSRRESPTSGKIRHHSRSRSSIVVRPADEEFASSPVFPIRDRFDSEEIDTNDEKLVMDELRLRSEGIERKSDELFQATRRTSHTRSNSTIGTTGRASGASSSTHSRHSRTGSSVTALSLDS